MGWMRGGLIMPAFALVHAGAVWAHGTGARVAANTATVVELYYTDGEPMAYAEAKVFSPEASDVPFVNGRADKLGRVTFAADHDGLWRVEAHDNGGHSVRTEVTVADGGVIPRQSLGGNPWLLWTSLFVNVFALVSCVEMWRRPGKSTLYPNGTSKTMEGAST